MGGGGEEKSNSITGDSKHALPTHLVDGRQLNKATNLSFQCVPTFKFQEDR